MSLFQVFFPFNEIAWTFSDNWPLKRHVLFYKGLWLFFLDSRSYWRFVHWTKDIHLHAFLRKWFIYICKGRKIEERTEVYVEAGFLSECMLHCGKMCYWVCKQWFLSSSWKKKINNSIDAADTEKTIDFIIVKRKSVSLPHIIIFFTPNIIIIIIM